MALGTTDVVFSVLEGRFVDDDWFPAFSAVDALAIILAQFFAAIAGSVYKFGRHKILIQFRY